MRLRVLVAGVVFAWTAPVSAQTVPPTTICLARLSGADAANWNFGPSIVRDLTRKITDRNINVSALLLNASDDKQAAIDAAKMECSFVVYSQVDRKSGEVSSQMSPSPLLRRSVNSDSTTGTSTLHFGLKIKDTNGKKLADDKVDVVLLPNFGAKDYEERGHQVVNSVTDKIIAVVTKPRSASK